MLYIQKTQHKYKGCTQVLCYVQAACNKYDQHDTHTAVSVAQRLSVLHSSCQDCITGVSIAKRLSALHNNCQYCITAELVTCQGTTCPRQTSNTVHQQFKAADRHQDRQWQKDWGSGPPVCGGLTRRCGEPPLSVAAIKQHVKPAGDAVHHTRSACITCIPLPFVACEIGPLLLQYDNALPASAVQQYTSCYLLLVVSWTGEKLMFRDETRTVAAGLC